MLLHGEYDHKDRTQRKFTLSQWYLNHSLTEQDFKEEEKKCRPLCPCHHAQNTHNQHQEEVKVYSDTPNAVHKRAAYARGVKHNNMRKRQRGACANPKCQLPVVAGEESMFDYSLYDSVRPETALYASTSFLVFQADERMRFVTSCA